MTEVVVTQADIDAAIDIRNAWDTNCDTAYQIAARHRTLTPAQAAGPVLLEAVMGALWPILGGNHTDAETWQQINDAVSAAITQAEGPQP